MPHVIAKFSLEAQSIGVVEETLPISQVFLLLSFVLEFVSATADHKLVIVVDVLQHIGDQFIVAVGFYFPECSIHHL